MAAAAVLVHETDGDFDEEELLMEECLSERNSRRCKTWAPVLNVGLLQELRNEELWSSEGLTTSDDGTTCSSRSPSKETITSDQDVVSPQTTATVDEDNCPEGDAKEGADEYEFNSDTDSEGGQYYSEYPNSRPEWSRSNSMLVPAPQLQQPAAPQQPTAPQQPPARQEPRYAAPDWCHWAAGAPQQSQPAPAGPPALPPGWHGSGSSANAGTGGGAPGASPMGGGGGRKAGGRRTKATKAAAVKPLSGRVTTVMVRNLPCGLKQQDFVREIDATGFEGTYDVCYLPRDFSSGQCKGYAFVNFMEAADATRFRSAWHQTERFGCREPLVDVSPAHVQGYEANSAMANSSHVCKVRNPSFRRIILNNKDQASEPPSPLGAPNGATAHLGATPAGWHQPAASRSPSGSWSAWQPAAPRSPSGSWSAGAFGAPPGGPPRQLAAPGSWSAGDVAAPPGYAAPARSTPTSFQPPCHEAGSRLATQELLSTRSNYPAQTQVSIFALGAFAPQRRMFQETPTIPVTSTPNYCNIVAR